MGRCISLEWECNTNWKSVQLRFHKFTMFTKSSQNNYHSPLDSANNKCYITARTKEGEQKENKEISSMRFLIT